MVTTQGVDGFQDFFMDDPENRGSGTVNNAVDHPETCADSGAGGHELPLCFDPPTMRGMM